MTRPFGRLERITKRFGPVTALDGAGLELFEGEVHGVLGENGAGKTTLLNVLAGMLRADSGRIEVDGSMCSFRRPRDAWEAGVGMVHQHFTLVPALGVLENLALGLRSGAGGWALSLRELEEEVAELCARTGLEVPRKALVEEMGVGDRQRVEILKALLRRPRLLILDEPTAVLTPHEVASLFRLLRELAGQGTAIVLVAHKLDEVLGVAHRVTVLRRGRTVLRAARDEVDQAALTSAMVGREDADPIAVGRTSDRAPAAVAEVGPVVASLEGVAMRGSRGEWALDGVDLEVRRGEIVGIAGVEGNGQRELALALAGCEGPSKGLARVPGGVGFIPQDRTREGIIADFDLTSNVALALHRDPGFVRGPVLLWKAVRERTRQLMERFDVRAPGPEARAGGLSGGNQQRLVVARELAAASDLLVAENPTRGLDVAAASFVHTELVRLSGRKDGPGVVLLSTDLDEVLALSHRVMVVVRGRLEEVPVEARTREGVGTRMLAGARA